MIPTATQRREDRRRDAVYDAYFAWLHRNPPTEPQVIQRWDVGSYTMMEGSGFLAAYTERSMTAEVERAGAQFRLILRSDAGECLFNGRFSMDEKGFLYLQGNYASSAKERKERYLLLPASMPKIVGSFEEFATAFRMALHTPEKVACPQKHAPIAHVDLDLVSALPVAV